MPNFFNNSLNKFFKDVFPALPVIAIIFAEEFSRLIFAKYFKKEIEFFILITLFRYWLAESVTTQLAPFLKATFMNLFPLFDFPLIAKNRLPLFIDLVSDDNPLK